MLKVNFLKYYYQWKALPSKAYLEKVTVYIETVYNYNINCLYGCYIKRIHFVKPCHCIIFNILGAFGVVHKGEMIASDGILKAVAIKTIKCQFKY